MLLNRRNFLNHDIANNPKIYHDGFSCYFYDVFELKESFGYFDTMGQGLCATTTDNETELEQIEITHQI